ncbi:MAG TPA: hypothetical protein VGC96_12955 [Candidatus Elarobacter sp.]
MTSRAADRINYLNAGLMLLSCAFAFAVPFELFLFSYAVLGPLHYLTEISWLHDRKYFVGGDAPARGPRPDRLWLALVAVALAVMLAGLLGEKVLRLSVPPAAEIGLLYVVFVTAAVVVFVKHRPTAALLALLTVAVVVAFSGSPLFGLLALFLVTIVHVLAFTAAFILFGALKGKSVSALLSLAVFALCTVSFFVFVPPMPGWTAGTFVRESYVSFQSLNAELIKLFNLGTGRSLGEIYGSPAGLAVMRLIAFAYTYHYLNWFSKTSVIKWHDVPAPRIALIGVLWAAAVIVYARSYELGYVVLYVLSVLHVMLEFPLNHQSFAGIAQELRTLAAGAGRRRTATG